MVNILVIPSARNVCLLILSAGGTDLNPCWEHPVSYTPASQTHEASPVILPMQVEFVGQEAQDTSSCGQLSAAPCEIPTAPIWRSYS